MFFNEKLNKKDYELCLIAVDELIKRWENLGVEVGDEWYVLRRKLEKKVK